MRGPLRRPATALLCLLAAAAVRAAAAPGADEIYRRAGEHFRGGDSAAARGLYQRILLDFPGSPVYSDSVFFLAETEMALGELTAAERHLDVIRELYPESPYRETAAVMKCVIASQAGRLDEAVRLAEQTAAEYPGGGTAGRVLRLAGDILLRRGRFDDALAVYPRSLAALRGTAGEQGVLHAMGVASLGAGRTEDAVELFTAARDGPLPAVAESSLFNRAVILADLGRREESLASADDFLTAFPGSLHREEAARLRAMLLEQAGVPEAAREGWDLLVREFPRSRRTDEYLYFRGMASLRLGQAALALPYFQAILRDRPLSPLREQSAYTIGVAYARRGEFARALTYLQPLLSSFGAGGLAERSRLAAAACSYNLGAYEKALAGFESLARSRSGNGKGLSLLRAARTRYRMERLADAALEFREASTLLEDARDAAEALYWLGWCHFRMGRLALSADAFLEAAARSPAGPRAAESLLRAGMGAAGVGDDPAAVGLFDRAAEAAEAAVGAGQGAASGVETGSVAEKALYEKGMALGRLGQAGRSDAVFEELSQRFPGGRLGAESSFRRAFALLGAGRPGDALALFRRVSTSGGPLAEQALYWSGEAGLGAGEAEDAAAAFWQYLVLHPSGALASSSLDGLERSLSSASDPALARAYALRARVEPSLPGEVRSAVALAGARVLLPVSPADVPALVDEATRRPLPEPLAGEANLLRGQVLGSLGEWAAARELFSGLAARRQDRVGARARIEEARALEALGRTREATEALSAVASGFGDFPDLCAQALSGVARILRLRGEEERARSMERSLRARYPDSPWALRIGIQKESR